MLTFALASLVLIMIPGPDQALITRNTLAGGRAGGLLTMAGGVLGVAIHASAAALGISALLATSATAFTVLKLIGAAYLLWMGISAIRAARRTAHIADESGSSGRLRAVRQGFLSNALNPKVALFFVTFLPQFLPSHATLSQALLLCSVFAVLYVSWFSLYVLLVEQIGKFLRRPTVRGWIERVTGVMLIGFALRLGLATA
jgi:threonine/homoserine/homoserine lactone efflux protein